MTGGRDDGAIAHALASMAQVLAQANEQASAGHRDLGEAEERRLDRFLRNSLPTFKGRYDPDGAYTWMQAMERIFRAMLRACVSEQGVSWVECLLLIEFTYNNSFHSSIGMTPFKALYGRRCRTPLCWYESGESALLGPKVVQETMEKVKMIQEKMRVAYLELFPSGNFLRRKFFLVGESCNSPIFRQFYFIIYLFNCLFMCDMCSYVIICLCVCFGGNL
jgi:hypothetical protein